MGKSSCSTERIQVAEPLEYQCCKRMKIKVLVFIYETRDRSSFGQEPPKVWIFKLGRIQNLEWIRMKTGTSALAAPPLVR
jgi:hypothetical protein